MDKPCPKPNQVRNPRTGRCIDKDRLEEQLRGQKLKPCLKPNQVRNPTTGRCINKVTLEARLGYSLTPNSIKKNLLLSSLKSIKLPKLATPAIQNTLKISVRKLQIQNKDLLKFINAQSLNYLGFTTGDVKLKLLLQGDSANCKHTDIVVNGKTFFIKVQVDATRDSVDQDNLIGYVLAKYYKPYKDILTNYVDSFPVGIISSGSKTYLSLDKPDNPKPTNIQESLANYSAVFNLIRSKPISDFQKDLFIFHQTFCKLGMEAKFVHNDAHMNNVLYNPDAPPSQRIKIIDYGRANFTEKNWSKFKRSELIDLLLKNGKNADERLDGIIKECNFMCSNEFAFMYDLSTMALAILSLMTPVSKSEIYTETELLFNYIFDGNGNPLKLEIHSISDVQLTLIKTIRASQTSPYHYLLLGVYWLLVCIKQKYTDVVVIAKIGRSQSNVLQIDFKKLIDRGMIFQSFQYLKPCANEQECMAKYKYLEPFIVKKSVPKFGGKPDTERKKIPKHLKKFISSDPNADKFAKIYAKQDRI